MKILFTIPIILLVSLCFGQLPPDTEIYLFDLKVKKKQIELSNPINITNRKGYDNQPFFHPDESLIYFSSANEDGRTDIRMYNYQTGETGSITTTPEREYSPTITPDKKFISCIIQRDDGAQDLGQYPIKGGQAEILINNLVVGYHAWIDSDQLVLFVLGQPNSLRIYSIKDHKDRKIAEQIGRSLHRIPGTNSISFVDKQSTDWLIKRVNPQNDRIETLVPTLPNREDLAWTADGKIIMSDGEKLFFIQPGKDQIWKIANFPFEFRGITRIAINQKGDKLALVVNE
jgi:hypothetical protein